MKTLLNEPGAHQRGPPAAPTPDSVHETCPHCGGHEDNFLLIEMVYHRPNVAGLRILTIRYRCDACNHPIVVTREYDA